MIHVERQFRVLNVKVSHQHFNFSIFTNILIYYLHRKRGGQIIGKGETIIFTI